MSIYLDIVWHSSSSLWVCGDEPRTRLGQVYLRSEDNASITTIALRPTEIKSNLNLRELAIILHGLPVAEPIDLDVFKLA